jgi:hypothetical protein
VKVHCLVAAILACAFASTAWGQQSATPKARDSASPLAETLQLIEKELNEIGRISFVVHVTDKEAGNATTNYSEEISKAVADPANCTIRYHWWREMHGDVTNDEDVSINLHDVLGVWMGTSGQYQKKIFDREKSSPDEKQTLLVRFDPPMFVVAVRTAEDNEDGFSFVDEKKAMHLGKSFSDAVRLCGGRNQPF